MKLLFIINPVSGSGEIDFHEMITAYFESSDHAIEIYDLPKRCILEDLKTKIDNSNADRVIAVGGDGTIKLVSECLLETQTPMGLVPAGSANGMARELGIPATVKEALDIVVNGKPKKIHAITVNKELCIHLADIGFNAYIVKKFNDLSQRGMWGYTKAAWKALWNHHKMEVQIKIKDKIIHSEAAMVVIANATMYGTGVKINPNGKLDDDFFEVILVKKYSVMEILKLRFTNLDLNPKNIEAFQVSSLSIKTKHKAHFQVDGEYMGKVNRIEAEMIPKAINVIT